MALILPGGVAADQTQPVVVGAAAVVGAAVVPGAGVVVVVGVAVAGVAVAAVGALVLDGRDVAVVPGVVVRGSLGAAVVAGGGGVTLGERYRLVLPSGLVTLTVATGAGRTSRYTVSTTANATASPTVEVRTRPPSRVRGRRCAIRTAPGRWRW
jgi:hypothetical protein